MTTWRVGAGSLNRESNKTWNLGKRIVAYVLEGSRSERIIHLEKSFRTSSRPRVKRLLPSAEMKTFSEIIGSAITEGYVVEFPSTVPENLVIRNNVFIKSHETRNKRS